jgi:hypothetical protein
MLHIKTCGSAFNFAPAGCGSGEVPKLVFFFGGGGDNFLGTLAQNHADLSFGTDISFSARSC